MSDRTLVGEEGSILLPRTARTGARGFDFVGPTGSGSMRRFRQLAVALAVTDALAVDLALLGSRLILHGKGEVHGAFYLSLVLGPLAAVLLFAAFGLYRLTHLTPVDEFRRVIEATVVGVALRVLGGALFASGSAGAASQSWLALTTVFVVVTVLGTRLVWHQYMARLRTQGKLAVRALIIGANEEAAHIADALHRRANGFFPVGLIDTNGATWPGHDLPILGSLNDVSEIIRAAGIESVFIAGSAIPSEEMQGLLRRLRRSQVDVRISANITEILASRLSVQPVGSLLALSLPPVGLTGMKAMLKRSFDLVGAGLCMIAVAPVWIVVPILIRLTTRGPALYKQTRIGKDARPFTIYKFRTMVRNAEHLTGELASLNEGSGPLFVMKNDPRVTPVGRLLRKLSLDELPQLINVLKGDMSLVGPRPPLPREVRLYEDWHLDRLRVRPGLTGLWQVGGRQRLGRRNELSFDDHVRLDLFYIENWSLAYDLFLLMKTVPAILSQAARGEYG